jgi:F-type H+-transporting ATPase subunit epsilon
MLSTLEIGVMSFETPDGRREFAAVAAGGFAEVFGDAVTVLADTLELAHEIDLERARKAAGKAQERLKAKETFLDDLEEAQRKLQRSLVRQEVTQFLLPPH